MSDATTALYDALSECKAERNELRERLEAAEAVIRRLLAGWHVMGDLRGDWWCNPNQENPNDKVTSSEAEAIARARADQREQADAHPVTSAVTETWTVAARGEQPEPTDTGAPASTQRVVNIVDDDDPSELRGPVPDTGADE